MLDAVKLEYFWLLGNDRMGQLNMEEELVCREFHSSFSLHATSGSLVRAADSV